MGCILNISTRYFNQISIYKVLFDNGNVSFMLIGNQCRKSFSMFKWGNYLLRNYHGL